ncbi:hypothetical protein NDU88_003179 [Pleurodeles waltl]|uniref:Uncharacterized protein n=1 Tax=Pleurodeles waltl TaxID=8319 RepID=A0AAV7V1S2_PLEWA|nr:hypothetical protein NDU88_003179 [Pleurodeles waltl]
MLLAEAWDSVTQFNEAALREVCFVGKEVQARRYGEGDRALEKSLLLLSKPWASDYKVKLRGDREVPRTGMEEENIIQVIRGLPEDKAPGLDDLTSAFYKEHTELLAPHLCEMFAESIENGVLPPSHCS